MDTYDNYRSRLREIVDYAFSHGTNAIGLEQFEQGPPNTWGKEIFKKFMVACHDGFKIAQKLLIEEIKKYQTFKQTATNQLKVFKRKRDKINANKAKIQIDIIERRLHNFSHIANGIAWQLLGGQIHIARRLHTGQNELKDLNNSNIAHAIKIADKINETPTDFALISDLSNFIHIGDLLVRQSNNLLLIELKEGKVNDTIQSFFEESKKNNDLITDDVLDANFDKTTVKQIKRMQRQIKRGEQATEVIKNDKGIDPRTGSEITIQTPIISTEFYHEDLSKLQDVLKTKVWAYDVVDNCVHIGMYRDEGLKMTKAIEAILKKQTNNYIVVDWVSITENLSEPIFAKPFPPDFIVDVLTGRIKMVIGINLDSMIEAFNYFGLATRWLTEKETAKIQQFAKGHGIVVVNKRAIAMKVGETETIMSGGILSKILYDNIKPTNIALSILEVDKES